MVDGVEQPVSYDAGLGNSPDAMKLSQNMYEVDTLADIKINKGPASTLYGSDALGGAVIMRTKNPEDLLKAGDDTYAGFKTGYNSADSSFKQTPPLANRTGDWETLLVYTNVNGSETVTHGDGSNINGKDRGKADPYGYTSNNVLGKVFYQINDAHRIGLTGEWYSREGDGRVLSKEGSSMGSAFVYTNNHAHDDDTRKRLSLSHEWSAESTLFDSMSSTISWQELETEHLTQDHTQQYGNRDRLRVGKDDRYKLDVQFEKELATSSSRHQFTYGVSAMVTVQHPSKSSGNS